jgi:hypothetical protein
MNSSSGHIAAPGAPRQGPFRYPGRRVPWETLAFGVFLGYFEAACVAYLRRLQELGQLGIPVGSLDNRLLRIEVGREAASLGLLAAWAWAAGRTRGERLGHFALAFAVWDILYYVFLRLTTGWPQSLMEWDVLFLIPAPWYGPVVTPVLVALLLAAAGLGIVAGERAGRRLAPRAADLLLVGGGVAGVLAAFLWNAAVTAPLPSYFPWWLFAAGWLAAAGGLTRLVAGMRES